MWNKCWPSLAAVLSTLFVAASLSAYDLMRIAGGGLVYWNNGNITMAIKMGTSPTLEDGTNYSTNMQAAMVHWNGQIANVQLVGNIVAEGPATDGGGGNEIAFSDTVFGTAFGEKTLAVTTAFYSSVRRSNGTYRRTQADIIFNSARTWNSFRGATRSGVFDIRRVAIHELGHVLGLDHPDEAEPPQSVEAIMNSRVSSVDALAFDDIEGVQMLYGAPSSVTRPANDAFAAAVAISLANNAFTTTTSNAKATKEIGEPNHAAGEPGGSSVWWKWTASGSGSVTINTRGSTFDTLLAAYTGPAVNALTQLAANDDEQPPGTAPDATRLRTSLSTFSVTAGNTYYIAVDGWDGETGVITLNLNYVALLVPTFTAQPVSQNAALGANVTFTAAASSNPAPTYQWRKNGTAITGATGASHTVNNVQPADAGLYSVTATASGGAANSTPAILAPVTTQKVMGTANELSADIRHPNGKYYDQLLLTGSAATFTADPGQVTRISYIDLSNDIVQVEFSGAGSVTLVLDAPSGPAAPVSYNQAVSYMKGHGSVYLANTDSSSYISIFTVGRMTAYDPTGGYDIARPADAANLPANNGNPIFKAGTTYDGVADLGLLAITSASKTFGGVLTANTSYWQDRGYTGIYAPGVFIADGRVYLHDLTAFGTAIPVIQVGGASNVRVTGGNLKQDNNRAVQVSGFASIFFAAGTDSHGNLLPTQANQARLEENGVDVTAQRVTGGTP
jgi:hypothetical protein